MKKKKIHLAFDLSWTTVETQWRLPDSWVDRHHPNIGMFEEVARTAERGGFDMIFFGDSTGIPDTWKGSIEDAVRHGVAWPRFEMSPWITKMSAVTSHLGFGLTYASTFMHPFYTARLLNSLDHITNGRIAFNVITSQRRADYANYGHDELPDHNERYDRLEESSTSAARCGAASTPMPSYGIAEPAPWRIRARSARSTTSANPSRSRGRSASFPRRKVSR
jgi:alkanesulfonate monooxygenase SsuD/methylene tetrahydromethanopterin reductase-like flavin-dependent oxidoreductase (luciferase family)